MVLDSFNKFSLQLLSLSISLSHQWLLTCGILTPQSWGFFVHMLLEKFQRQKPSTWPLSVPTDVHFQWILHKMDVRYIPFHGSFTWGPELLKNANVWSFERELDGFRWNFSWKTALLAFSIKMQARFLALVSFALSLTAINTDTLPS